MVCIFKKLILGNLFATERGRMKLFRRMVRTLFPSKALALNMQTIGEKLGEAFVYKLGHQVGSAKKQGQAISNRSHPLVSCIFLWAKSRSFHAYFRRKWA